MPNIKSAIKRVSVTKNKTSVNSARKSELKTAIKKVNSVIVAGDVANSNQALTNAVKLIDKAAANNIIHKNNAARKKSSLQKKLNALNTK